MFDRLFQIINSRKVNPPPESYTNKLFRGGEDLILRKVGEESLEVILAAKSEGDQRLIEESADLIYHLFVLLAYKNIDLENLKSELITRHQDNS